MSIALTKEPIRSISFARKAKRFTLKVLEGILDCIPFNTEFQPTEVAELLTGLGHYMPPDNITALLTELANDEALSALHGIDLYRTAHRPPKFVFRTKPLCSQPAMPRPEHSGESGPTTHRLERVERMLELLLKNLGLEVPS
jgi:hypothetical protein